MKQAWHVFSTSLILAFALIVSLILGLIARNRLAWWLPTVVATDKRNSPYGLNTTFGFEVERPRWHLGGARIHIWTKPTLKMRFDIPYGELICVTNQRWLAKGRAILLTLRFEYHDSGTDSSGDLGVLYDYQHGDLHSCGDSSAWFVWSTKNFPTRNTSCGDLAKLADEVDGS